ncbi:conserved hypothetical protein [Ricinus communis]|uniref:Uncharacterized protein n=1 Tax=Ricinus communis TaxID=3988 RepID=B9TAR1_RICCO|nr:conserved hypothetical protein [Ricinus communis]
MRRPVQPGEGGPAAAPAHADAELRRGVSLPHAGIARAMPAFVFYAGVARRPGAGWPPAPVWPRAGAADRGQGHQLFRHPRLFRQHARAGTGNRHYAAAVVPLFPQQGCAGGPRVSGGLPVTLERGMGWPVAGSRQAALPAAAPVL